MEYDKKEIDVSQVVKIGASSIIHDGKVREDVVQGIAHDINRFRRVGIHSTLVVSGSIKLGMIKLGYKKQPDDSDLVALQRCAGVGQSPLVELYSNALVAYRMIASQLQVTFHNLEDSGEEENIERRIKDDIANGLVTLINYNDCIDSRGIVTPEGTPRDNDLLASQIARYIDADRLVIITNSNGKGTMGGRETKEQAIREAKRHGIDVVVGEYSKGLYNIVADHNKGNT